MPFYPHCQLFLGPTRSIVISGPHIQVLATEVGEVIHSTHDPVRDDVIKSGPVRCAAIDADFQYLATVGDDKKLKVWSVEGLVLQSEREVPKKPTQISFAHASNTIVISDKFGDVFSYPLHPPTRSDSTSGTRAPLASHNNSGGGKLVLGHASLVTAFTITPDERSIVTADRDEHIRVSWFPQGYNIQSFCLGHRKFVSAVHIPHFAPGVLVSGGGDTVLKFWEWETGAHQHDLDICNAVTSYMRVLPSSSAVLDDDDDGAAANTEARKKVHGRKNRGKAKKAADEAMDIDSSSVTVPEESTSSGPEPVLAVHKISSLETASGDRAIVFDCIGATALFACAFPSSQASSTKIAHYDFAKPVIDYAISEGNGLIWALLDTEWSETPPIHSPVCVVRWTGEEIVQASLTESMRLLLDALNSTCRISAAPLQLTELDLYGALSSLPKNKEVDRDPMDRSSEPGKELSGKEAARRKNRRAVEEAMKATNDGKSAQPISPGEGNSEVEGEDDEPAAKRPKE